MFTLMDTFNNRTISRHRTLDAAYKASVKHDRAVKHNNGPTSYIPTVIIGPDGEIVDVDHYDDGQTRW